LWISANVNGSADYQTYDVAKQFIDSLFVWCEKYRVITKYFRSLLVQAIIITDVMKVCHASNKTEETAARCSNLSYVASGHHRCVIHERGINRKLKIVITRRFRSLTVISTLIARRVSVMWKLKEDSGREISLYICHYLSLKLYKTLKLWNFMKRITRFFLNADNFSLLLIER